jgi:hypothetical protein
MSNYGGGLVPSARIELATDPYQGPVRPLNYEGLCVVCDGVDPITHLSFKREVLKKLINLV